jgi:gamma-glutamyl-gamma-aminobutyrate hydrolase PuuD
MVEYLASEKVKLFPILISYFTNLIEISNKIHGLVVTGGRDIDP